MIDAKKEALLAAKAGMMKLAAHGADAGLVQRIKTTMTG
jgi:hypothetical protein